ncbi:unnamed protein product [Dibothriocephalus latus]|uniref:Uncharacterized protein n=1 Tax=Dibothriocephalus latus TaxID=60516 RepID=A0A3P6U1P4_DIBLA|nr:unnamed protein product [Dibothriocephalus latus]
MISVAYLFSALLVFSSLIGSEANPISVYSNVLDNDEEGLKEAAADVESERQLVNIYSANIHPMYSADDSVLAAARSWERRPYRPRPWPQPRPWPRPGPIRPGPWRPFRF